MKEVTEGADYSISIVVPVLNDGTALRRLLRYCRSNFGDVEIVVADGGSHESPRQICDEYAASLVICARGRGTQMNCGAAAATGKILWFVHADHEPGRESLAAIHEAMKDGETAGGAFRFSLASRRWYKPMLDFTVGIHSQYFRRPLGDQAFFVRRSVFEKIGGFPPYPILEDFSFFRRMAGGGRAVLLSERIGVSSRRWEAEGFIRGTIRNTILIIAYRLGVPPDKLARWYSPPGNEEQTSRRN